MSILCIATPIDGASLRASKVSLGFADQRQALSHVMPTAVIYEFAKDVVRARNRAVARALQENATWTHMLWWDEDMWPEDVGIVQHMINRDVDVVGAPYTNKMRPLRFTHEPLRPEGAFGNGVQEVRKVGLGFTLVKRSCLEALTATTRKYRDWPHELKCANMFGQLYEAPYEREEYTPEDEEALLSEDYSFCARWRRAGGKIHILTGHHRIFHAGYHGFSEDEIG